MKKAINRTLLKTILIILLAILIALISILSIGYFYKPDSEYYVQKVAIFTEENKSIESCDAVFIGDSLTDWCDFNTYYPNCNFLNRGIGGDTTKGLLKRMKVSVYDVNPKVIVVLIGANDVFGGIELSKSIETYDRILKSIKRDLPNTKIIVQSNYPMGGNLVICNEPLIEMNKETIKLAQKYQCTFVDMYTPLFSEELQQLNPNYTIDGVHLNSNGYKVVTNILKPIIENLLN